MRPVFQIEAQGDRAIYGDTDSLFVLLGIDYAPSDSRQVGESLAASLNRWWQEIMEREVSLEAFLEIELETHFLRFLGDSFARLTETQLELCAPH